MDGEDIDKKALKDMKLQFKKFNIPYILVINKCDKLDEEKLKIVKDHIDNRIPIRAYATKYNISITSVIY